MLISNDILDKVGNWGKVNPPLRNSSDNKRIYEGLFDGTIDTIGTDHAPHNLDEKNRDYPDAPSGFPGFETSLPLLLNEVNKNKLSLEKLEQFLSSNAADIFQIEKRGKIEKGYYADLTIVDMDKEFTVEPEKFHTKGKYSPFTHMDLSGDVYMTIINGEIGFQDGQFFSTKGHEIDYTRT